jgi:hypothetical protein
MFLAIILSLLNLISPSDPILLLNHVNHQGGDSLTIYVFLSEECMISQFYTLELSRLYDAYHENRVGFIGYFPNESSNKEKIETFASSYQLDFPLLQDHTKVWTRKFGIKVTPEVAVWDHRTDQLLYRGRIDDSYVRVGKRKLHTQHRDLQDAIDGWNLRQSPGTTVYTQAIGCLINFTSPTSRPSKGD